MFTTPTTLRMNQLPTRLRKGLAPTLLALAAGVATFVPTLHAQTTKENTMKTSLTIYSSSQPGAIDPSTYRPIPGVETFGQRFTVPGYAVIRTDRTLDLTSGRQTLKFDDVAAYIDPTTVSFTSLTDPTGTSVLEQNYQFDLVSGSKLLERFINQPITVTVPNGDSTKSHSGILLTSNGGQLVLQEQGQLRIVNGSSDISLPKIPEGLVTKPTLIWDVKAAKAGAQEVRVSYQTEGITWWADYNLVLTENDDDANKGLLDVSAWVSILNQAGATFPDARIKLIAGTVNRAPKPDMYGGRMQRMALAEAAPQSDGFAEKSFFEYHLYTLGRTSTIPNNSTKQIELFPGARNVPCDKILVYDGVGQDLWMGSDSVLEDRGYGVQSNKDVNVYLQFKNTKDANMGMPLPAGRIRINKIDSADGSMEFIGEDIIRHTPKDETILVKLGNSFDVVGERIQKDYKIDTNRKTIEETIEIKLRNRKEVPINVVAQERMYRWTNWEITKSTIEPKKLDARLVHFPVTLKAGEEGVIRYTVKYTW